MEKNTTRGIRICLSMMLAAVITACTVSASSDPPQNEKIFGGWALNEDEENLYETGTQIGTDKADDNYNVRLKAVYKEPEVPTAVIYNDGAMIFYEGNPDPADEKLHEGIYNSYTGWDTIEFDNWYDECTVLWHDDSTDYKKIKKVSFRGNVAPVTTAGWFKDCTLSEFDAAGLDLSNVTYMDEMFYNCTIDSLDLSEFNTENVTSFNNMFYGCEAAAIEGLSEWNTKKVTRMKQMFRGCPNLIDIDLKNWNVSSVTNMSYMFYNCGNLATIDLSSWNPKAVSKIEYMFAGNKKLSTIFAVDWTGNRNILKETTMFFECQSLPGYKYNISGEMAKSVNDGGYFTDP